MLTRANLKTYQQLRLKKFRQKYGLFVVEGLKSVNELLKSDWTVEHIICQENFNRSTIAKSDHHIEIIPQTEFEKLSQVSNPQGILAITRFYNLNLKPSNWSIALDGLNDPGNLGTIIRIADWYGINTIYCSTDTVDVYNSKTISSSMGSFLRTQLIYGDLQCILDGKQVFATLLNGKNIREIKNYEKGIILIGNEANGISDNLLSNIPHEPITIPSHSKTESLNAAMAAAICCERLLF